MSDSITFSSEWLDVPATIEQFGYSPLEIATNSTKPVIAICQQCQSRRTVRRNAIRETCQRCANSNRAKKRDYSSFTLLTPNIDIQATIKTFGYDPCFLTKKSQKPVVVHCYICGETRTTKMEYAMRCFTCVACSYNDPMSTKNRSRGQLESANRPKKHNVSPEMREKLSKAVTERRQRGILRKNRGGWYTRLNGDKVFLSSSYELGFSQFLDFSGIEWKYEPKGFKLEITVNGECKSTSYWPDFYLTDFNRYIEVKGYWYEDARQKFEAFLTQYPEIDIEVWDKPMLQFIGAI